MLGLLNCPIRERRCIYSSKVHKHIVFLNVTLFDNGGVVKCVWWSFGKFTGKKPVFNGSEVYLEASQTSTNKFYCE